MKPTLRAAFKHLLRETGYVRTMVLAAPNPDKGGMIDSMV